MLNEASRTKFEDLPNENRLQYTSESGRRKSMITIQNALAGKNSKFIAENLDLPGLENTGNELSGDFEQLWINATSTVPVPKKNVKESIQPNKRSRLPLSAKETIKHFRSLLTDYEVAEILDWTEIYFAGSATVEKVGSRKRKCGADLHELFNVSGTIRDSNGGFHNYGYDDSRGDLYLTKHDHVGYRYEILSLLGKGSFGQVAKCYDHKTKSQVAIKVIRNKKRFEKQGMVEVSVLKKLTLADQNNSNNLVHVLDHFYFRGHLCFVFDLLGANLYEWIKAGGFRGVHLGVVRKFGGQILRCLSLLSELNIIHCDLKPENILLRDCKFRRPSYLDANITSPNSSRMPISSRIPADFNANLPQYDICVIDFGSSCYESERLYTYVQSRFYRSPEVILGLPYGPPIDMWSFGCVLAEMYTGYPLFAGEDEAEQLACIMEVKGLPSPAVLSKGNRSKDFFDSRGKPRALTNSKGKQRTPGSKTLQTLINSTDAAFLEFIECCLTWDPKKRMTPKQALSHPFITKRRFILEKDSANNLSDLEQVGMKQQVYSKYSLANGIKNNKFAGDKLGNPLIRNSPSLETLKNRLPKVTSITRFGARLSTAVGYKRERSSLNIFGISKSKDEEKDKRKQSLPPISSKRDSFELAGGTKTSSKPLTAKSGSSKTVKHN